MHGTVPTHCSPERDSKSQYVYPLLGKAPFSHLCISITSLVLFKNSSDLSSGRRPESKSDEFLKSTKLVIEIISVLLEIARR